MPIKNWMIYGANGFTGELIAREAKKRNMSPILAGRNKLAIPALARELGLESKTFELEYPSAIIEAINEVDLVLHCAGPFSDTSSPMVQACLAAKTHYLDITGEIAVFERIREQNVLAKQRQIMLMPGVGFDVVPTDCLALNLKKFLPDATHLILAFDAQGGISKGTARSVAQGIKNGCKIRQNGMIKTVPYAYRIREIHYLHARKLAATIPWGDISTAFQTTGIPNIEVYKAFKPGEIRALKILRFVKSLVGTPFVQNFLKRKINRSHKNPDPAQRANTHSYVWGQVQNQKGETKQAHLSLPNSYDLTVYAALGAVEYFFNSEPEHGSRTPAAVLGEHFIRTLPGVEMRIE